MTSEADKAADIEIRCVILNGYHLPYLFPWVDADRAQGFTEGIEAATKWLKAEYTRLLIMADADRREGRYSDATEMLNRAIAHAMSVPAIRALAPASADQERPGE
jgi:hypothetical protein